MAGPTDPFHPVSYLSLFALAQRAREMKDRKLIPSSGTASLELAKSGDCISGLLGPCQDATLN